MTTLNQDNEICVAAAAVLPDCGAQMSGQNATAASVADC